MKRLLSNTIDKINRKKVYEGTLKRILEAWQKEGSMPENAPRCVQKYIIDSKDKDKFYAAFEKILQDELAEKNTVNIDRLMQVFTQAKNADINSKTIKIVHLVIQKDLNSKNKSIIKKDPELAEKLLEIVKSNFADCFADQDEVEETTQNQPESKEFLLNKETKNKTEKDTEKNENWSADDIFTYQALLTLLSSKHHNTTGNEKDTLTSPNTHHSENNNYSVTENFTIEEVKLVGGNSSAQSTVLNEEQKD